MKKIIPILLLFIVCINHLNILDAVWRFTAKYKVDYLQKDKHTPIDEESSKESKEKLGEEDKVWYKNTALHLIHFNRCVRGQFFVTCSPIQPSPFPETDIQPPKTV